MTLGLPARADAADIQVPAGGNLQAALDAARPGDTILLAPGAIYVGNFTLPVHGGSAYVTLRTGGDEALLPGPGTRISPAHAPYLAKLRSPNNSPALRTEPRAAYWRVMLLEMRANQNGAGDILALGTGATTQNSFDVVPQHLIIDRVYVHGDPLVGQKRGILINSGETTIVNSYISEIKAIAQDTQAIAGANGPGPFHIENNYLEAAGNVFIIGGDDPKIPGLVPDGLLFRGNILTRPLSWRQAIVPSPGGLSAVPGGGGTLAAGTYAYRVVARRPAGTTTATSARSAEVSADAVANGSVTIRWNAVPDATEYRVYGRTPGGQSMYWRVTTTSFTDTGGAGTAGTAPSSGTVWQVKNLFELKNFRNAQVDFNVMENNWQQAQSGIAVLLTVRNQYGDCTQCVVEDVTFEYNIVRNIGGGFTILGEDYNHPSQQTNNIRIRNNEFSGLDRNAWGGNGYFIHISEGPRDIVVDHNTIVSPSGLGVITVTGPPVPGFVFTNNVARHNSYGIFGTGMSYGNVPINHYFPGGVFRRNVLAGGKASSYPADNLFPSVASFEAHFRSYAEGDFSLASGTDWTNAGTDARDLGADYGMMRAMRESTSVEPPRVVTVSLPSTTELASYAASLEASGGRMPYRWSLLDGSLPDGITLDPLTGMLSGAAASAGDFVFTVRVTDALGATAAQPLTLHAETAIPPVQIMTAAIAPGVAEEPYAQHLEASGGRGTYIWSVAAGQLPSGLTLYASGDLAGTPATSGTSNFTVTVHDVQNTARSDSRSFSLFVAPPPNRAPIVSVRTDAAGVAQVGAPVTITADAVDSDGVVSQVRFYVNGILSGTAMAAPFRLNWTARDGSPHAITAVAVDDDGAQATSAAAIVQTTPEIVIYAGDVRQMAGDFQLVSDAAAAGGRRLWNPNRNVARVTAMASPVNYAEFTFFAEAGRPYHIWMRGLAQSNNYNHDSFSAQFSGTVTATGAPTTRIGTTSALNMILEDGGGAGVLGWGWQDSAYDAFAAPIYFERTGLQTLRFQQREDGLSIDQVVISPGRFFSTSPGLLKNDTTIVARP